MSNPSEYWIIAVEEGLEDASIATTTSQRADLAAFMQRAHEMHSEATGQYLIPNPRDERISELEKLLKIESSKVVCRVCWGLSRNTGSRCYKCDGEGKHIP